MKDDVIHHRGLGESESCASPAKIGWCIDETFELVPRSTLSDKVYCVPSDRCGPAYIEVVDVEDLIPKLRELRDYCLQKAFVSNGDFINKLSLLLGEKLSKKVGE